MASRRFFDPYDYYYAAPHPYAGYAPADPYYAPARSDGPFFFQDAGGPLRPAMRTGPSAYCRRQTPRREGRDGGFFPGVPVAGEPVGAAVPRSSRSFSVPVCFAGSEPESGPEGRAAGSRAAVPAEVKQEAVAGKRGPSAEEAVVMLQAAARGFMARRMMREVRAVEREAEAVATRVVAGAEALHGDARARVAVGEELMRLLLRLDAVRGVREYRRRVTKRVLALQDAVDALEHKTAPVTDTADAPETQIVEAAEESDMAPELPHAEEAAEEPPATETAAEMEVDGGTAAAGEAADPDETEQAVTGEKARDAEGEWENLTEEEAVAGENPAQEPPQPEPAGKQTEGGTGGGLDARRVMEMMAALCERSAQQCALIGALAERVDTLEQAVRRVEEADRRRRRSAKKLKEGKGGVKGARRCYRDE